MLRCGVNEACCVRAAVWYVLWRVIARYAAVLPVATVQRIAASSQRILDDILRGYCGDGTGEPEGGHESGGPPAVCDVTGTAAKGSAVIMPVVSAMRDVTEALATPQQLHGMVRAKVALRAVRSDLLP